MADGRSQKAKEIFGNIYELKPSLRDEGLKAACGQDAALRAIVEQLIKDYDAAHELMPELDNLTWIPAATVPVAVFPNLLGTCIGAYRLLMVLGNGGYGVVYLAERRDCIVQRVALKVLMPGMNSAAVIARFEQERQALAVMEHPNIARVFDAGTTDQGLPYFVMEYVAGETITRYADIHRLSLRERLQLFLPVCDAVQHAHHKGIIHRDLKPVNILVSSNEGQPHPKVIDFGVAKCVLPGMTDTSICTQAGQLLGTPAYMSPEQADPGNPDIDSRVDVYALGAVLYELLAGFPPFDPKVLEQVGYEAMRQIICESEPPRPSARLTATECSVAGMIARNRGAEPERIARELRTELDWIPLKAMRKRREDRYSNSAGLARDIRNYLDGQVLEAGPESTTYRVRKLLWKYRSRFLKIAAALACLGLCGTALWAHVLKRQLTASDHSKHLEVDAQSRRDGLNAAKINELEHERQKIQGLADLENYLTNLRAADAALAAREPAKVRACLDACPESVRGWEWSWLNATSDQSIVTMRGHESKVSSASFSPDGSRVVTASSDQTARIWDAATGRELVVLRSHRVPLRCATFNSCGDRVVTFSSYDWSACVHDAMRGVELRTILDVVWVPAYTSSVVDWVVTKPNRGSVIRVLDVSDDRELASFDTASVGRVSVAGAMVDPSGCRVVLASPEGTAYILDSTRGQRIRKLDGHTTNTLVAVFSPDRTRLATVSADKSACIWSIEDGNELLVLRHPGIRRADFDAMGSRIVTSSMKGDAKVWDATTGELLYSIGGGTDSFPNAYFSPSGDRVVVSQSRGVVTLWSAARGVELAMLRSPSPMSSPFPGFSASGDQIVVPSADGTIRIWETRLDADFGVFRDASFAYFPPEFDRDDDLIWWRSIKDGVMRKAEVLNGRTWRESVLAKPVAGAKAQSADGRWVACLPQWNSPDVVIRGQLSDDSTLTLRGHSGRVLAMQFSDASDRIVTASEDKTARVWEVRGGQCIAVLKGHSSYIHSARMNASGDRVVTASNDQTARVWDSSTGEAISVLRHDGAVRFATFSHDGTFVVTTAADRTAKIWDAVTGREITTLDHHDAEPQRADFHPLGGRVATGSSDGSVRIWDTASGRELIVMRPHQKDINSVVFSPDGSRLLTSSTDGSARIFDSIPYRERLASRRRRDELNK